ncbi:unnamed protein product [Aphanomyces euteiches]
MEETSPFPNALARVTRTRSMETVVSVPMPHVVAGSQEHPLPLQGQAELDELRMQNVERAAASSSPFNTMTYEQLAQFHAQQEAAIASRLEQESARQAVMAAEIEKSRREQEESRAILLQQQQQLQRQQEKLKLATAQQAKVTGDHQSLLQQGSEAMRQQHSKVGELDKKVHRDSERWGLLACSQSATPITSGADGYWPSGDHYGCSASAASPDVQGQHEA